MFIGEFKRSIDDKGSLLLPRTYSPGLASGFVVTRGFERNLMIFGKKDWQALVEKVLEQSIFNGESRTLRRRLFSNADEITPDSSGRITLPASLCAYAEIVDEAILAGMYDYLEIWSDERWAEVNAAS